MNCEKLSSFSLGPCVPFTTKISMPATASKITHSIKCLIFEFTKPPGPYSYRRRPRNRRFRNRSRLNLSNSQHLNAVAIRGKPTGHAEPARPNNSGPNRYHRPLTPFPSGNPRFLEESFEFLLARAAHGLKPVTRLP